MQADALSNVEVDGGLTSTKKGGSGGGARVVGKSGGYPILGGGQSCESARNAYVEEMSDGRPRGQADLTQGQYSSVLNRGSYFGHCGVPDSMHLTICAAVQNGRAVGVTVISNRRAIAHSVVRRRRRARPELPQQPEARRSDHRVF